MKDERINVMDTQSPWLTKTGGYAKDMTMRDYFAAKAMQSYMINEIWNPDTYKNAADKCYRMADAMLKAKND